MGKDNYYSILNLKEDCSTQDIKDAFIKLSKQYHPDMNADKADNAKFLKVNEAYSVLNKPSSREMYDRYLVNDDNREYRQYYENIYTTKKYPFGQTAEKGPNGWNQPYYSVKGIKKVSNSVIVYICFAVTAIGLGMEVLALRKSFTFDRERLVEDTARNQILWEQARAQAESNGNDVQIRNFKANLLKSSSLSEANKEYERRTRENKA